MKAKTLDVEKVEKVAFILKALGNPLRISIIDLLRIHQELSVNQLSEKLGAEQSLVSHNLSNMKLKGILSSRREGKNIYYHLKLKEVLKVLECMQHCEL
ncbi:MAG: metalloregulator ArsR/SmtB family transcription factor [Cyclobacteriaceae bacterium]|nr:metalloregulator ArsR/SmtB family transcription factor [Cyclobacteriaceae bacterium]